jgi:hypothetical protein
MCVLSVMSSVCLCLTVIVTQVFNVASLVSVNAKTTGLSAAHT